MRWRAMGWQVACARCPRRRCPPFLRSRALRRRRAHGCQSGLAAARGRHDRSLCVVSSSLCASCCSKLRRRQREARCLRRDDVVRRPPRRRAARRASQPWPRHSRESHSPPQTPRAKSSCCAPPSSCPSSRRSPSPRSRCRPDASSRAAPGRRDPRPARSIRPAVARPPRSNLADRDRTSGTLRLPPRLSRCPQSCARAVGRIRQT
mmetsp:Transcript_8055/g.17662  ORF Transcript_8055/g.17662 Transcript_8055/m.17662 type:complete len:206 (+) Transcript_8055:303-920(+)